jgi:hypothetical protein
MTDRNAERDALDKFADEAADRKHKEEIFLREHNAQAAAHRDGPFGDPRQPAGRGPIQPNNSPGADNGDGLKA